MEVYCSKMELVLDSIWSLWALCCFVGAL